MVKYRKLIESNQRQNPPIVHPPPVETWRLAARFDDFRRRVELELVGLMLADVRRARRGAAVCGLEPADFSGDDTRAIAVAVLGTPDEWDKPRVVRAAGELLRRLDLWREGTPAAAAGSVVQHSAETLAALATSWPGFLPGSFRHLVNLLHDLRQRWDDARAAIDFCAERLTPPPTIWHPLDAAPAGDRKAVAA